MTRRIHGVLAAAAITTAAIFPASVFAQTSPASTTDDGGFFGRLVNYYAEGFAAGAEAPPEKPWKYACMPGPLDSPPFPSSDFQYGGNPGMCSEGDADSGALMAALAPTGFGQWLTENRISIYGWVEPGGNLSTAKVSKFGNVPAAYGFNANRAFLDQATIYVERDPDTAQTDHVDWGFRVTNIYGTDYRYTTMYGWDSSQLLQHNRWAGWDMPMAYFDLYVPDIGYGTNFRLGRYVSLPDIEAQLAPDNYMYSHSILYSTDPYTQVGLVSTTRLDPKGQWILQLGLSAGNDVAPWSGYQGMPQPTITAALRWTSDDNHWNIYVAANSTNDGKYGYNNLQSYYYTIYYIFPNPKWHTAQEIWYMYQNKTPAANNGVNTVGLAGSVNPRFNYGVNGPFGAYCNTGNNCQSREWATINYTMYEIDRHNSVGLRLEYYDDLTAQRTGYRTQIFETTFGWNHYFSDDVYIRPEVGFYHALHGRPFSNGGQANDLIASMDLIWRY